MGRLTFRQIEAFRAVMLHGTVTHAAEQMNTSQPSVSRAIQELEDATRLILFRRVKRRIEPTGAATEFFKEVARAFTGLDDLERAAEAIRGLRGGAVRVICFPALSEGFMAEVFRRFVVRYPNAHLTLEAQHTPTIVEEITAQRFDIGLAGYDLQVAETVSERLTNTDHVCVLPANHALAEKPIITPADLRDLDFISAVAHDLNRQRIDEVFGAAGVARRSVIEAQSTAMICAMVVRGMGVAIINPYTPITFQPWLAIRPFSESVPFVTTLLRPKYRPNSPLPNAMIAEIKKYRDEIEATIKGRGAPDKRLRGGDQV